MVKISSNRCLYNIIWNLFQLLGLFTCCKLANSSSSLKRANNVPKLPGVDYVGKNWALAMILKALPLVHFLSLLLLKEQMITSVRKTLKTLVWSAQNRLISSEICLENNHKIGHFLLIAFWRSLLWNFLQNSCEISRFFCEFVPKMTFLSATYQKPYQMRNWSTDQDGRLQIGIFLKIQRNRTKLK